MEQLFAPVDLLGQRREIHAIPGPLVSQELRSGPHGAARSSADGRYSHHDNPDSRRVYVWAALLHSGRRHVGYQGVAVELPYTLKTGIGGAEGVLNEGASTVVRLARLIWRHLWVPGRASPYLR